VGVKGEGGGKRGGGKGSRETGQMYTNTGQGFVKEKPRRLNHLIKIGEAKTRKEGKEGGRVE